MTSDPLVEHTTWSMLVVTVATDDLEFVSDALWRAGVVAIEERPVNVSRDADPPALEEVELWTSVGEGVDVVVQKLTNEHITCNWRIEQIDRAIADSWREYADCVQVTEDVMICPSWKKTPDDSTTAVIRIDPHDMFGLGNHPTTQLALRLALRNCGNDRRVLDVGCGSGVLAVALSVLRGCTCRAFDIHPSTAAVVASNAQLNDCSICVENEFSDIENGWADVVLANILAPVLVEIAPDIDRVCRHDGIVVLSGLRTDQRERVLAPYGDWRVADEEEVDGWVGLVLVRSTVR
jgi:ribosomal protein L11 methyltransferase